MRWQLFSPKINTAPNSPLTHCVLSRLNRKQHIYGVFLVPEGLQLKSLILLGGLVEWGGVSKFGLYWPFLRGCNNPLTQPEIYHIGR